MAETRSNTAAQVNVEVALRWRRIGEVSANFLPDTDAITDVWMPLRAPRGPGLYRFTMEFEHGRLIYIGESESVQRRISVYKYTYKEWPQTTESFVTEQIRKALIRRAPISVHAATRGKIKFDGEEEDLYMEVTSQRRFAEAAAVLLEERRVRDDGSVVVLNRILNSHRMVFLDSF
ncbi:hypothetical protein [Microbispora sp. NPDC046933]|uniref:hypothetical protein n=1 Tax=Microbispora sp. NPDC046933 TaxID=3155618 RepID=UPI0033CF309C